jgi:carbonic anhydrase/acetyltransferase-like protein (isoleucine patch superfamily)
LPPLRSCGIPQRRQDATCVPTDAMMNPDPRFPGALLSPTASIFGDVAIGVGSSVWLNAVVRCETQKVRIGRLTNLQDFAMIHVGYDHPTTIGDFCSITHHATVHGAHVGDACLIGIGAVLMDGVVLGAGSIVAGGAVATEGSVFEPGSIVAGIPAKVIRRRDATRDNRMNAWLYHRNACAYSRGEHRAWDGAEFERWKAQLLAELASDADLLRLERL